MIKRDTLENLVNISYLAIGSNIGNRKNYINKAKYYLNKLSIHIVKSSGIYETPSWPNSKDPKFYNTVIKVKTNLKINNLFTQIKIIEKKLGRNFNAKKNSPRTCDIDIIDFNNEIKISKYKDFELIVPHKELSNRNFVLFPLQEIIPTWKHPKTGEIVSTLIQKLSAEDRKSILMIKKN